MAKARKRPRRRRVSVTDAPWGGDHGTGTRAAMQGTVLEPIEGENPNRIKRRRRVNEIIELRPKLSQRQFQAAQAIEAAYCRVQTLSSGSPLQQKVDITPKPDATVARHTDAQSHLVYVMASVPPQMRDIVEHVCWHNRAVGSIAKGRNHANSMADLKVALDLVANHMRY